MSSGENVGAESARRESASLLRGSAQPGSVEDVTTAAMRSLVESGRYRPATGQWRGSDLRKFSRYVSAEFGNHQGYRPQGRTRRRVHGSSVSRRIAAI